MDMAVERIRIKVRSGSPPEFEEAGSGRDRICVRFERYELVLVYQ